MTTSAAVVARDDCRLAVEYSPEAPAGARTRQIPLKTSGNRHRPVTRLVSRSDIGELVKPFVFLDQAEIAPRSEPVFGAHPHSDIATLTVVLRGGGTYGDTTGISMRVVL